MENHIIETQPSSEASKNTQQPSKSVVNKKKLRLLRQRRGYADLLMKTLESQMKGNETNSVQFVNPTRPEARRIKRLYDSIKIMARDFGEVEDHSRVWLAHIDTDAVHPMVTIMGPDVEVTLVRVWGEGLTIPVALVRCKRLRIHVAAGELTIKEIGFACRKTTVAKKYQTIELTEKDLRARRFRFSLSGDRAVVLVEKLKTEEEIEEILETSNLDQKIIEPERGRERRSKSVFGRRLKLSQSSTYPSDLSGNSQVYILNTEPIAEPTQYQSEPMYSRVPVSYIRNSMTLEEIQRRILFIDCEFVMGHKELKGSKLKGVQLLASIAIMNYHGQVILDTRVTPAKRIRSCVTRITGFRLSDLINQRKEEEIIREVQELVKGRILIGHDLTSDLSVLRINIETLAGIRDLSTSPTLRDLIPTANARLSLKLVSEQILARPIHKIANNDGKEILKPHSALEDVQTIRDVYLKIETIWRDTPAVPNNHMWNHRSGEM